VAEKPSELVVETFKLTKIYQNRQIALNDVTLRIEPGTVLGLLGSNGAGKTTLLRLIIGLHRPTAGWAKVFGKTMTPNAAGLRRRIGYIPTNPRFPRGMTPITYLDYMARLFGLPRDVRIEFDVRSEGPDGDVKWEMFGDGRNHSTGYLFLFGAWRNRESRICKLDEHALTQDEARAAWKPLIDFVDVSLGSYVNRAGTIGGMYEPPGYQLPTSLPISRATALPSIVAGRFTTLEAANEVVASGRAAFVGMTRAHIADPDALAKFRSGRAAEVRPCIACNGCAASIESGRITLDGGTRDIDGSVLYIDCSADGLAHREPAAVFTDGHVSLQPVRTCQPAFSAAVIARRAAPLTRPSRVAPAATLSMMPGSPHSASSRSRMKSACSAPSMRIDPSRST